MNLNARITRRKAAVSIEVNQEIARMEMKKSDGAGFGDKFGESVHGINGVSMF